VGLFPSSACFLHPFPYAAIASLP